MSKSYSQLLRDIESGDIVSITLVPNRREVVVEFTNGEKKLIPIFYNDQKILRISEQYNVMYFNITITFTCFTNVNSLKFF